MVLTCFFGEKKKSEILYLIKGWSIQNYQVEPDNRMQYCSSIAIQIQIAHHAKIDSLEMKIDFSVVFH